MCAEIIPICRGDHFPKFLHIVSTNYYPHEKVKKTTETFCITATLVGFLPVQFLGDCYAIRSITVSISMPSSVGRFSVPRWDPWASPRHYLPQRCCRRSSQGYQRWFKQSQTYIVHTSWEISKTCHVLIDISDDTNKFRHVLHALWICHFTIICNDWPCPDTTFVKHLGRIQGSSRHMQTRLI